MNELQKYVDSLPSMLLEDEKIKLIEQWKKNNNWGQKKSESVGTGTVLKPEETKDKEFKPFDLEEVKKIDPVVKTETSAGSTNTVSDSEGGFLDSTKKDSDWDFWKETGVKIKANTINALGNISRIPTLLNEFKAAISREFMSDKERARYDALDPLVKQVIANIGPQPGMTALANSGLENYKESVEKADKIRKDLTEFETSIGEEYAKGNFVEATVRTASDALGSLPSVIQSMIPYVGITSIVMGEAASASAEAQEQGKDLSLETLGYSTIRGAAEGLLEVVTKKIGGNMFKSLAGKSSKETTKSITEISLGIAKSYGAEGLSETATDVINKMADAAQFNKKDTFENHLKDLIDTFLVGGMMGGGMSSVGASAEGSRVIKNTIQNNSVQSNLDNTNYNNIIDAFKNVDITKGVPDLVENKFAKNKFDSELNKKLTD